MTEIWDVVDGFIFFVTACFTGGVTAFVVGTTMDTMKKVLFAMGIDAGAGTAWDSTWQMNVASNLTYAILFLFGVVGLAGLVLSVWKRNRLDVALDSPNPMQEL